MDRDANAIWMESVKSILGLLIILVTGSWFDLDRMILGGTVRYLLYIICFDSSLFRNERTWMEWI